MTWEPEPTKMIIAGYIPIPIWRPCPRVEFIDRTFRYRNTTFHVVARIPQSCAYKESF